MKYSANDFYNTVENADSLSQSTLIDFFAYYLTVDQGAECATAKEIDACFTDCDLTPPRGTSARLSEGAKAKPPKYIKVKNGYKLHRHLKASLSKKIGAEQITIQTNVTLRALESKLPEGGTRDFLKETIDCFEAGANRATITMAWILTVDHLFSHILKHKLSEFNTALSSSRGLKVKEITKRDDFNELKEVKFIELCRTAKIISNDVRKILDTCLGIRNSCSHPSGIAVKKTKVISVLEDLIENVITKYET
ncbi:hypothetical protein [Phaeobacter piscinae]|uniref:hypothetical protein n=1 Tax=Phaeobacter piscinae TaxID=1580596 RepID=UPI000CA21BD0|nr:hypothetical protein [Phaeobacter piscinae]AUQ75285.1 hypothetical protein PhaeoP71_02438 [Phaeobacter piscinae]